MSKTLNSIQSKIETLQSRYRELCSGNNGVIRGAADSDGVGDQITHLMNVYNSRAKRTMYYGGKIVPRKNNA